MYNFKIHSEELVFKGNVNTLRKSTNFSIFKFPVSDGKLNLVATLEKNSC